MADELISMEECKYQRAQWETCVHMYREQIFILQDQQTDRSTHAASIKLPVVDALLFGKHLPSLLCGMTETIQMWQSRCFVHMIQSKYEFTQAQCLSRGTQSHNRTSASVTEQTTINHERPLCLCSHFSLACVFFFSPSLWQKHTSEQMFN